MSRSDNDSTAKLLLFTSTGWDCVYELQPPAGPIVHPSHDNIRVQSAGGIILAGECGETLRKICPTVTLSTTNPIWNGLVANLGLRGERPATNRLSLNCPPLSFLNTFTGLVQIYGATCLQRPRLRNRTVDYTGDERHVTLKQVFARRVRLLNDYCSS
jgi:hypothetical protein